MLQVKDIEEEEKHATFTALAMNGVGTSLQPLLQLILLEQFGICGYLLSRKKSYDQSF